MKYYKKYLTIIHMVNVLNNLFQKVIYFLKM